MWRIPRVTGRIVAAVALCALGPASPARPAPALAAAPGGERILGIDGDVHVLPDGSLRVQETIRIRSTGQQFKHGLQREFPQTYAGPFGSRSEVGFQVEEVLRDGEPEPFVLRRSGNDAIIRAGQRDVLLDPGEHTYRITYVTDRQLGFFTDHDELYWNVVGTAWRLPVDQATATITLPQAAQGRVRAATAYIGAQGSRERAKLATIEPFGATFVAGRPLRSGEGLTVVVEWPKGIVPAPPPAMRFGWWLRDNRDVEVAVFGILVLAIFVRATRARLLGAGDATTGGPGSGAATYEALASAVSPCLLRYVVRGGFDDGSLPVAILDMAERGCVVVRQTGAHYRVERTDKAALTLPPEEQSAASALFGEKTEVELAPIDAKRLSAASEALKWDLDRLAKEYFADGKSAAVLGVLLSFVIVGIALGIGSGDPHIGIIVGLFFGGLGLACFATAGWLVRTLTGREMKRASSGSMAIALVFVASVAAAEIAIGNTLARDLSPLSVGLCGVVLFLGYRAARLRRLRTRAGEALHQAARRVRRSGTAPATTGTDTSLIAGVLPYAMALDAVATWEEGIGDLARAPDPGFRWLYRDPNWLGWRSSPLQWSSFTDDFSSMTAKAAGPPPGSTSGSSSGSSSSSSSSSSGSSEGGSSGGGGGGGGGGGW